MASNEASAEVQAKIPESHEAPASTAVHNAQGAKVIVHWLEKSRAFRIPWLLEECNIPYELKLYKRDKEGLAEPALKKVHPLGKSPVIEVIPEGGKSFVIAESGLITEYIVDHFGPQLKPKQWKEGQENKVGGETEEWMRYRYFMHYTEGSLQMLQIIALVMNRIRDAPVPFFLKPIIRQVPAQVEKTFLRSNFESHYNFLEDQLKTSGGDYLCGKELTGSDIMIMFSLEFGGPLTGVTASKHPLITAYIKRNQQRDAYKRAVARCEKDTGEPLDMDFSK